MNFLGPELCEPELPTYRLVGDNLDKNVRPRDMRVDHQTRSMHCFHTYGVRDRVDISSLSSETRLPDDVDLIQLDNLLPSSGDDRELLQNFGVFVARTLMKYVPFFEKFGKALERHIVHEFSEEMAKRSEVVC